MNEQVGKLNGDLNSLEWPDVTDSKKRDMLRALKLTLGIVSTASEKIHISRDTHYRWMKEDPAYKDAVKMVNDTAKDFAESKLFELMNGVIARDNKGAPMTSTDGTTVYKRPPDVAAVIFYLKTKAKDRGFIERVQLQDIPDGDYDSTLDI